MKHTKFEQLFKFLPKSQTKAGDGASEGKYPFYTSSNSLTKFYSDYLFEGDSLIFGTGGNASIHFQNRKFSCSTDCLVAQPIKSEKVLAKFVFYYLSGHIHILENGFKGAGLKHISKQYINSIKIPIPYPDNQEKSLAEQKRIAAILDKADEIRKKRAESLRLADEFLKSTFLDMFGDPVKNPKRWEKQPLLDVLSFTTGKLDSNAAEINGKYPFFTCSQETFKINSYEFDCEALLLAGNNAAGVYSIKHYKGKFNAYQRTYVITIKNPTHSYEYYKTLIEFKLKELQRNSKGTNTKYLTMGIFERMYIPIPSESLQKQYSSIVKA
ncbi:MAG: restriction endonuclease subunit S [bacterium]|nr:restriction endonuclease subunit S [bacterium]